MTSLQVNCLHGMVMIKSSFLDYSNIKSMYKTGDGCCIQTEHYINEVKALDICNKIADLCYQLEDVQKTGGYDDKAGKKVGGKWKVTLKKVV